MTYAAGWNTEVGTEGLARGIYYNTEFSADQWGVDIFKYNVWLDVNPDFDPDAGGGGDDDDGGDDGGGGDGPNDGLEGNYRGRGQYDAWDVVIWADDGIWFTPTGTLGFTGMWFNDFDGDEMYSAGEDVWLELFGDFGAEGALYDMQEMAGIAYLRTFVSYASIGDSAAWAIPDPGSTNDQLEINQYVTTKTSTVGEDGMFSCFMKYVYLHQIPRSAEFELFLFGVDDWTLYINGFEYVPDNDPGGEGLVTLLKQGRNQIYLWTDNAVARILNEINYHYNRDYAREETDMKFDARMTVNGVQVIVRGDETVMDPRAVWHGQAWSTWVNNNWVVPLPDLDLRMVFVQASLSRMEARGPTRGEDRE